MDLVGIIIWLFIIAICAAVAWWIIRNAGFGPEGSRIATLVVGVIALLLIVLLMLSLAGYQTIPFPDLRFGRR